MHTAYPVLVTIPERLDGAADNTLANAGLTALSELLVTAIEAQGYDATIAWGGLGKDVVLAITRRVQQNPCCRRIRNS